MIDISDNETTTKRILNKTDMEAKSNPVLEFIKIYKCFGLVQTQQLAYLLYSEVF